MKIDVIMENIDNRKETTIKSEYINENTEIELNLVDFVNKLGQIKDY